MVNNFQKRGAAGLGNAGEGAEDVVVDDTRAWLGDETVRDIPKPGEPLTKGQPICTVFAEGSDIDACLARLKERAQSIVSRCSSETSS